MILSTCSTYFRTLFATVAPHQYPVIVINDTEDEIMELLVRYMYSGQVSVTEEQLVPLVQAAKTLGIKGLVDVPVPDRAKTGEADMKARGEPRLEPRLPSPPSIKRQTGRHRAALSPVNRIGEVEVSHVTTEPQQEEGVDPSGSEIDQSVSQL